MQSPETTLDKKDMQEKGLENAVKEPSEYAAKVMRQERHIVGNIHHQPLGARQRFVPQ
jgi:hypothetical protein